MRGLSLCLLLAFTGGASSASTGAGAICKVAGDPFYTTFDGARLEFQGKCVYDFASYTVCHGEEDEAPVAEEFNVYVQNTVTPHDKTRSYTSMAHVDVLNHRVSLRENGRVTIDDVDKTEELEKLDGKWLHVNKGQTLSVKKDGNMVTVTVENAFTVTWDARGPYGRHIVTMEVINPVYKGLLKGICGDYNGKEKDDHNPKGTTKELAYASDTEVGNSWIANSVECL